MGVKKDFLQSIKTMVHSAVNNATYDKIYNAQITDVKASDKYDIRLNGDIYTDISVYGSTTFNIGDIVKVVFPQNQSSQMFILGKSSAGGGGSVSWNDITNKPTTFTPTAHTHTIADVFRLADALNSKVDKADLTAITNAEIDTILASA